MDSVCVYVCVMDVRIVGTISEYNEKKILFGSFGRIVQQQATLRRGILFVEFSRQIVCTLHISSSPF